MAQAMKRFNPNKVRPLGNLQALNDKQKARLRAANGIKQRWAVDDVKPSEVKTVREYLAPVKADYQPPKLRGRSGTRLSPEKRSMVELRRGERRAFFASLGVQV